MFGRISNSSFIRLKNSIVTIRICVDHDKTFLFLPERVQNQQAVLIVLVSEFNADSLCEAMHFNLHVLLDGCAKSLT